MAAGPCTRQQIRFKTRRGRGVAFIGRPGGDKKYGGECPLHKKRIGAALVRIAKHCAKTSGGRGKAKFRAVASCVKHKWA